ncbi:MAG: NAD(P)-dependent oxidoreductase [Rhodospirillales bacterium]|nr:MAG: NAD(P)-dependent oxidoreductase [Rhodospirillales bacterium]
MDTLNVAFIGLGVMGFPMAGHLATAGHRVRVFNRTAAKAEAWLDRYPGDGAASPAEACRGADLAFLCVGNDADVRSVVLGEGGAMAGLAPEAILIDHTTTSAVLARELAGMSAAAGVGFLDAPVSGGQAGAEQGRLTVMCGGEPAAFARAEPVLKAYARAVTRMGPVGSGQLTKMVNQICIAGLLQSLAEGLSFAETAGLDVHQVVSVIARGAAQSWQMDNRADSMLEDRFDFGFAVDWMRKDLAICLEEARASGASIPVAALVDQFYADIQRLGGGRWDTSSLIRRLRASVETP